MRSCNGFCTCFAFVALRPGAGHDYPKLFHTLALVAEKEGLYTTFQGRFGIKLESGWHFMSICNGCCTCLAFVALRPGAAHAYPKIFHMLAHVAEKKGS